MTNFQGNSRHIAFYLPSLRGGGAERVMVTLANGFAALGHQVDLVVAKAEGPYLSDVGPGVRLVDFNQGRVITSFLPLVSYLRRERPDAMLSALSHANIIAILARQVARYPARLVASEHSAPSLSMSRTARFRLLRFLMRSLYPKANAIVCVSEGMRKEIHQIFRLPLSKIHRIYNPLDVDRIRETKCRKLHSNDASGEKIPLILAAGRLTRQKDYPNLLHAFAHLRAQRPARLAILGQGEDERRLKALAQKLAISDHVDFLGFQHNPFVWMKSCDVYVMSSRWEGLPGTLLEAMACGARVVSTDCKTGPDEILEGGKWGRLVPVGDAKALAEAIAEALDDPAPPDTATRVEAFRIERAVHAYAAVLGCGEDGSADRCPSANPV